MKRRSFIQSGAAVGAAAAYWASPGHAAVGETKPNFIYFLCDDLGYGDLHCFGHPEIQTPNLDAFTDEGLKLTSCYSAAPVCSPARAGFLTGRIPERCAIYDHISSPRFRDTHDIEYARMSPKEITIAELLKDGGYETCLVGKWHLDPRFDDLDGVGMPDNQGFDYYMATENNAASSHKNPRNFIRNGEKLGKLSGYSNDLILDECVHWLTNVRDRSKPFFLYVALHSPHENIATPPEFTQLYDSGNLKKDEYYGNVSHIDAAFGRLDDNLSALGLRDSTFVTFTSDNGPAVLSGRNIHDHNYGSSGPLSCRKNTLYEGGIRVPGIMRLPGTISPGTVSNEPTCGIDMLPTMCELAGIEAPADRAIDGTSILPLFSGNFVDRTTPLVWTARHAKTCDDRPDETKTMIPQAVIRKDEWKLVAGREWSNVRLFNLEEDLAETVDRSEEHPERTSHMLSILQEVVEDVREEGLHREPIIRDTSIVRGGAFRGRRRDLHAVEVYTLEGKLVKRIQTRGTSIPDWGAGLPNGMYLVRDNKVTIRVAVGGT